MTISRFEVPDWIRSVLICDPTDIWGNTVSIGLAELAARLTGLGGFDRRGQLLFGDSFDTGLARWYTNLVGTLAAVEYSSTYAFTGAFSAKLTGGSDGSRYAEIYRIQQYPSATKLGFEFAFTIQLGVQDIQWRLLIYTGTRLIKAYVKYVLGSTKIQYADSGGNWQDLQTGVSLATLTGTFHFGKLVMDPTTEKYVRFILGKNEYDMSALSCQASDATLAPYIISTIRVTSDSGVNAVIYIDNVILTHNEPA